MPTFSVTIRVGIPRATDKQVGMLLRSIPNAVFDPMRRELTQSSMIDSVGEGSARDKAVRHVTWALDDAGLRFTEYSIVSNVAALFGEDTGEAP